MAMKSGKDKGAIFNEINITPLTDIFLVLLIIMMVLAPSFQKVEQNINVPEINSGVNVEDNKVTVSITKDNVFFVNGNQISPDQIETELQNLIGQTKTKNVIVKADTKTKNSEIMKVIRAAQGAGYEKLTVAGEPLTKKQQKQLTENTKDKTIGE